jgi:replicative DNA helicase
MRVDKIALPADLEAEQIVLGTMMINEQGLLSVPENLKADDFDSQTHKMIFDEMISLSLAGLPVSPVSIKNALEKKGLIEKAGGAPYLHTLYANATTPSSLSHYVEIVAERSYLRSLIRVLNDAQSVARELPEDPKSLSQEIQGALYELDKKRRGKREITLSEQLHKTFLEMEADFAGKKGGLKFGLKSIDDVLAGIFPGDLVVLAARPAMGKSALALNIAYNNADQKIPVYFSSLEMSDIQLLKRLYCQVAHVDSYRMRIGNLNKEEWKRLERATIKIAELPIKISDNPLSTVIDIKSGAREHFRKYKKAGLIIVDYLQLITPLRDRENTTAEVSEISRQLKILAKELECPVIALSQLSRGVELRANRRPQLSDLRGSGSIEQDADKVVFIHRELDPNDREKRSHTIIDVAKHRSGPIGTTDVYYNENYTTFHGLESRYDRWCEKS